MQYEKQKAACAEYAQQNGGSVADVLRVNGNKGAVVVSKDGRTIFDPFVIEPIAEVLIGQPAKEQKEAEPQKQADEAPAEQQAPTEPAEQPAPKKKAPARKKK